MVLPIILGGAGMAIGQAFLTDDLPFFKKESSKERIDKIRNLSIAAIFGMAISAIVLAASIPPAPAPVSVGQTMNFNPPSQSFSEVIVD